MSEVKWQIEVPTGSHSATYRGIRIVIKRVETGNPLEIGWFIGGGVAKSMPVNCDLESAKKVGMDVIHKRITVDDRWAQAEKRDWESDLWRQCSLDR